MKKIWIFISLILVIVLLISCKVKEQEPSEDITPSDIIEANDSLEATEAMETEQTKESRKDLLYETELIASGLTIPWEIAPMPDGRILITERDGAILLLEDGEIYNIAEVKPKGEGGLLGMALSPNFKEDHFIYLYYTYGEGNTTFNKVYQFTFTKDTFDNEKVILDKIPGSTFHNGGRLKFGPDDKLYITTGDSQNKDLSQDINSLAGKILRINQDGTIPRDNPFPNSPVFALGIRNSQGLSWHPVTDNLYASDHGPSSRDEINLIVAGGNYGWPNITCDEVDAQYINPVTCYSEFTLAPSGIAFFPKENGGEYSLYVAGLRGNRVMRIDFDKGGNFIREESILEDFGRIRTVIYYDDALYIATNNRDGRGSPKKDDDKIIKIVIKTN